MVSSEPEIGEVEHEINSHAFTDTDEENQTWHVGKMIGMRSNKE